MASPTYANLDAIATYSAASAAANAAALVAAKRHHGRPRSNAYAALYATLWQRQSKRIILPNKRDQAVAQAVGHQSATAEAQVQDLGQIYGICGGHRGNGTGFLRVLRFPLPLIH
jgi:hypothetical protein